MINDKPKWWKIILKEPGYWLIILVLIGGIGSLFVEFVLDSNKEIKSTNQVNTKNS